MMTCAILIVFALGGGPTTAVRQDPQPGHQPTAQAGIPVAPAETLTLEDALARAAANSQRLAELQARQEGAEAAEAGRAAEARPIVALIGGYTRTNHVDEFGIPAPGLPLRIIYPDIPDNVRARLDLQWPIYTGGRTGALERAARAEHDATGEDLCRCACGAASRGDTRLLGPRHRTRDRAGRRPVAQQHGSARRGSP